MEAQQEAVAAGAERKGVRTWVVEAAVAAGVLVLGLTVLLGSRKLGSGWTTDGPGPGYFPFYIGIILCVSALGILYQALLGKKRNEAIFVDNEQVKQVLMVLVPAAIYVGVVQLLGLYVASAIYIALFMIYLGKYPPGRSIGAALAIVTVLFCMFEIWFKVPLYKGMLKPLDFLGY